MTFTETFSIRPLAPFDFDLTAHIFLHGDRHIRSYEKGEFHQVLRVDGNLDLVSLTSDGTSEEPRLTVKLTSNNPITRGNKQSVAQTIEFIFNLGLSLCSFYKDIENDSVMRGVTRQLFGLKNPTTQTVFESLVDSIVEQQISIKVAQKLEERLVKKFGDKLDVDDETYFAFPTPNNIASASVEEIQQVGLSWRKTEYIQNAARLIMSGKFDLEGMKNKGSLEQIIAELDKIKGVGVWTAELTMLRGMQKLDALPADDFGLRRVISKYYCGGRMIKAAEAREISKAWGRWKGLAAYYLIEAEIRDLAV
jgi:DNA-3-methyladenine glycosylase II